MPETIKASEQNLNAVFSDDYLFEIPVYQRPYAWDTEQVDDLLDDLLYAMRRDGDEPYFLGSIVLIKGDDAHSQVVDGQQRLTTLTMLLCVLRELADGRVKIDLDRYIRQQGSVIAGTKEVVRFSLRDLDRNFFYANVQSDGGISTLLENAPRTETDSQQRIFENVRYLHEKMSDLDPDERTLMGAFIIQHCYLVVVSTSDMTSAYRIFSVMNDRGLDLSVTDILKAEIIGGILISTEQRAYADKWEDIEQELGRDRFGALFTHIRSVYAKAKQRRALQEEFREYVLKQHTATDFIDKMLDQYGDVYKTILGLSDGMVDHGGQASVYLEHLRRLDNDDWIPPAMAFFIAMRMTGPSLVDSQKIWKGWPTGCSFGVLTSMSEYDAMGMCSMQSRMESPFGKITGSSNSVEMKKSLSKRY
jgi:translation initiation factor 2 beta subunit (eIF-2beta)/eIF-5